MSTTIYMPIPGVVSIMTPDMSKRPSAVKGMTFGKRLRMLRCTHGLTQIDLAKAAGTTQRAISYYETDGGFPPAPLVASFAQALNISADELLGIKRARAAANSERLNGDRRLWKRFQKMTSLPERDQRAVIRLINSLSAGRSEARA
jgi:transcriptional regulator with XRE-family HTH domain